MPSWVVFIIGLSAVALLVVGLIIIRGEIEYRRDRAKRQAQATPPIESTETSEG